jgi:hypothetical protein
MVGVQNQANNFGYSAGILANTFANRPTAAALGTLFVSTDTLLLYRWTGSAWTQIGGGGGGGVTTLSNGLTLTGSNGTLGGSLTNDTTISSSTFAFKILSTNAIGTTAIFGSTSSSNDGSVLIGNTETRGTIQAAQTSTGTFTQLFLQKSGGDTTIGSTVTLNVNQASPFISLLGANVGIGTSTNAGYKLSILGGAIKLESTTSWFEFYKSGTNQLSFGITGGNQPYIYSPVSNVSVVWTNNCLQLYRSGAPTYNANVLFEVFSTTQGVLLPRMTTAQINAIVGPAGLMIYNTDVQAICFYDGTAARWEKISHSVM